MLFIGVVGNGAELLGGGRKGPGQEHPGQFEGVFGSSVGLKCRAITAKRGKRVRDKTLEKFKYQPWVENPNCPGCALVPGLGFQVLVAT